MKRIWVVLQPEAESEISELYFETDLRSIGLQCLGGLKPDRIIDWHDNEADAHQQAARLLYTMADRLMKSAELEQRRLEAVKARARKACIEPPEFSQASRIESSSHPRSPA
jgi:hypothetical protein